MMDIKVDSIANFRKIKIRQTILLCIFIMFIAMPILFRMPNNPFAHSFIARMIYGFSFFAFLVFWFIWILIDVRCPVCKRFLKYPLGENRPPKRCLYCGAVLYIKQSFLSRLLTNSLFATDPTKNFFPQPPPSRIIYDLNTRQLNGIGYKDMPASFMMFGPADGIYWYSRNNFDLLYSRIGISASLDEFRVHDFSVVFDQKWKRNPLNSCTTFYIRTLDGKEVHLGFETKEAELTALFGQQTVRFVESDDDGNRVYTYEVNGSGLGAVFDKTGICLLYLGFAAVDTQGSVPGQ